MTAPQARAQSVVVRLAVVNTLEESGLLREILPEFERQSGFRVQIYSGETSMTEPERAKLTSSFHTTGTPML